MSNRTVEAVLKLSARMGDLRALQTLQREMKKVDQGAKAINARQAAMARGSSAAYATMARFAAPAALAYGAKEAYTQFAGVERRINRITITAGEGKQAFGAMRAEIDKAAITYAMSQDDVTAGLEELIAAGRSAKDAMTFLPAVTATAQASGSDVRDIATTADAVGLSFDIAGDKMQGAFDILVGGGKMGKFELKDMASYLPSMAPAFATLGYKGEQGLSKLVAILQTVRQRTGSAEEAATAAQNVFQKMESEQTVKAFKKMGVNLRSEMTKARKEGRDLVDVFLDLTEKATKGDLSKLPQLFTDAQFQTGMRALLQGRKDLDGFAEALKHVDGSTLRDLGQVLSDSKGKIDRMTASWEKAKIAFGGGVADAVNPVLDAINNKVEFDAAIDKTLEKEGMSPGERQQWKITQQQNGWFGGDDKRYLKAYEGGWRSEEGKKAERPRMASPDAGMGWGNNKVEPDQRAGGGDLPIPTWRPNPGDQMSPKDMAEQYQLYGRGRTSAKINERAVLEKLSDIQEEKFRAETFKTHSDGGATYEERLKSGYYKRNPPNYPEAPQAPSRALPSFRELEDASVKSYRRDEAAIRDEIEAGGTAVKTAGQDAGAAIQQGGADFAASIAASAQLIASAAASLAQAGNSAAAKLQNVSVPAPRTSGAQPVNVNSGSTMTNAGRVGGPD